MNAKEISDATLESVTPADNDLILIYDTSEGTTGKATIAGIAPKVAENIDIATLESVTPADDDLILIYDTSEGTTGKTAIADIISSVGGTEPKTVSLYLKTSQLGFNAGSTVSVERFILSLWNYLTAIYTQADYFNVNGQMEWDDSQSFNITDGNRVIPSSGAKFDFFLKYGPWSCNGGIFLTASSGAYRVRCKYLDSTYNLQEDIFQITLV